MTAAPPPVSRNSSVVEMNEDGSMKVLRKGSGEWTCVPDDPSTPGNDPMCLDPNAMEWLHAYATKSAPPDKIGFIYMLQGGWDFIAGRGVIKCSEFTSAFSGFCCKSRWRLC